MSYPCGHVRSEVNTYRGACRTCHQERARRRWHTPEGKASTARSKNALKLQALEAYGGPICMGCGSVAFEKLGLDHVNEDGAEHRRVSRMVTGHDSYRRLRDAGWPDDPPLQVLCKGCNTRKANLARGEAA